MSFWRKEVIQPALDHDIEAAIAEQQAILAREANNARACFALGTLAQFKGRTDAAIGHFLKAIEADSNCAAPHVSLGRISAVQGNYDLAWKHAREAGRLGDPELIALLNRYPNLK